MKFIPASVTLKLGRTMLAAKSGSPRVLFVLGVAGTVASTVIACRATLKLEDKLEKFQEEIDTVKHTPDISRKVLTRVYVTNTVDIAKLYAPSILVGGLSIAALTTSHITLERRNAGLAAAFAAISSSYDSYRERVRAEVGADKELDIYQNARYEEIDVNGEKAIERVVDSPSFSPYARIFDESSIQYQKHPEYNRMFIQAQQNYWNHKLNADGYVFLNDVYESLGFERTEAGQVVGWVLRDNDPEYTGDNYIDFGIMTPHNTPFINGIERSVILDFNVDGDILRIFKDRKK